MRRQHGRWPPGGRRGRVDPLERGAEELIALVAARIPVTDTCDTGETGAYGGRRAAGAAYLRSVRGGEDPDAGRSIRPRMGLPTAHGPVRPRRPPVPSRCPNVRTVWWALAIDDYTEDMLTNIQRDTVRRIAGLKAPAGSTRLPPNSTSDPANASAGAPPPKNRPTTVRPVQIRCSDRLNAGVVQPRV